MVNSLKRKIKALLTGGQSALPAPAEREWSYSQCGEDLIVEFIFSQLGVEKPFCLDIGAFHPFKFNNTMKFYEKGARCINVEANPSRIELFNKYRGRDLNINMGIGVASERLPFYCMSSPELSTFSRRDAERIAGSGSVVVDEVIEVDVIGLDDFLERFIGSDRIDFLSVDIEGMDEAVLGKLDWHAFRPTVICVETINYTTDNSESKNQRLIDFFLKNGYMHYADTYINSIFTDAQKWQARQVAK